MILEIAPSGGKAATPVYRLKIVLIGTKPVIWRRLQAPANAKLDWLHAAFQVAIGWTNSHLHQFKAGGQLYSDTRVNFAEFEGDPEILEERKFTLQQIAPREKSAFCYAYDFGDSWEHEITVERILPSETGAVKVGLCLDGARACPPEDCGGIWGYDNLLKILKNRNHPEYKSMTEWLGGPFDAAAFDLANINTWLRKLNWPHVTDAHLRKVLMGRDNKRE